ncbi:CMGC family protein kinase [Trichomonas vaginalis G3]|uniref:CMGC family protein kinase n=1 Tax=Trichomonas vaginalis (strain ATCC PRA-98 / G3) TaxID=412133 RepID=A2DW50_TRIV3|nr:protein kinase superfamily [Trichomonas vaginalis G3]EAY15351.1 CMGC family protein kinase [Trichomonas vaginalis G3]KAI5496782.1 protein kinase superfamily [Trichomonas vaginalis G3]|eukprot:XP_001327574.1 CMGC family protein kinase [Trichomonas vaginalis G3]
MKAIDPKNGDIVAIKRVKVFNSSQSLPQSFYRETSNLQHLKHENIINLREVFRPSNSNVPYMVFDYCEFDLDGLIHNRYSNGLDNKTVKSYFKQILTAVKFCHDNNIIHRDLKPSNIFVTRDNVVKLGDFGLSRDLSKGSPRMTLNVVTPGYRAPELILGNSEYDTSSDIWSLGTILFEMITGVPLFKPLTSSDISQLASIVFVMGKPNPDEISPKCANSNILNMVSRTSGVPFEDFLRENLQGEAAAAIPLIFSMLRYNPEERISIEEALCSSFFDDEDMFKLPQIPFAETHSINIRNDYATICAPVISSPMRPLRVQLVPISVA